MKEEQKQQYLTPTVKVVAFTVESGFAGTQSGEGQGTNPYEREGGFWDDPIGVGVGMNGYGHDGGGNNGISNSGFGRDGGSFF